MLQQVVDARHHRIDVHRRAAGRRIEPVFGVLEGGFDAPDGAVLATQQALAQQHQLGRRDDRGHQRREQGVVRGRGAIVVQVVFHQPLAEQGLDDVRGLAERLDGIVDPAVERLERGGLQRLVEATVTQHQRDARRARAALLPLEHQPFPHMERGHRRLLPAAVAHERPGGVIGRLAAEVLAQNDAQGRDNLRVRRPRLASDLGIRFLVQPQHQGQHGGPDHVRLIGTRHEHPYSIEPGKPQKRSCPGLEIFAHPHSMQAREAIDPIDQRTDR